MSRTIKEQLLEVFYKQPSNVIMWTPDKENYSWGFPTQSRATSMLIEILDILTSKESEDKHKRRTT